MDLEAPREVDEVEFLRQRAIVATAERHHLDWLVALGDSRFDPSARCASPGCPIKLIVEPHGYVCLSHRRFHWCEGDCALRVIHRGQWLCAVTQRYLGDENVSFIRAPREHEVEDEMDIEPSDEDEAPAPRRRSTAGVGMHLRSADDAFAETVMRLLVHADARAAAYRHALETAHAAALAAVTEWRASSTVEHKGREVFMMRPLSQLRDATETPFSRLVVACGHPAMPLANGWTPPCDSDDRTRAQLVALANRTARMCSVVWLAIERYNELALDRQRATNLALFLTKALAEKALEIGGFGEVLPRCIELWYYMPPFESVCATMADCFTEKMRVRGRRDFLALCENLRNRPESVRRLRDEIVEVMQDGRYS